MALTKAEMSENLFEKLGVSKRDAKDLVESFFEEVRLSLENGEQVKLSGFGNFDLRDKNQRPGRNPKTGEDIPITARRVVTFRPGQKLKSRVEKATPKSDSRLALRVKDRRLGGLCFSWHSIISIYFMLSIWMQNRVSTLSARKYLEDIED